MKPDLFVDTSAWYALTDVEDPSNGRAKIFFSTASDKYYNLVSTNHVIGETYTLIRSRLGHGAAWRFLKDTWKSRRLRTLHISEEQERQAYELLQRYGDQNFSFVDGTSFVAMKESDISRCFTFDRHFATAGFIVVPA